MNNSFDYWENMSRELTSSEYITENSRYIKYEAAGSFDSQTHTRCYVFTSFLQGADILRYIILSDIILSLGECDKSSLTSADPRDILKELEAETDSDYNEYILDCIEAVERIYSANGDEDTELAFFEALSSMEMLTEEIPELSGTSVKYIDDNDALLEEASETSDLFDEDYSEEDDESLYGFYEDENEESIFEDYGYDDEESRLSAVRAAFEAMQNEN